MEIVYIQAENLKHKRSFTRILIVLAPLLTVLMSFFNPFWFLPNSYNWWYILIYPGFLTLICALIILLDVMMPGTNGFEFLKRIRNMVDCPILFLTAKTLEEDILFGLGIGADDYITKPFRVSELRARVAAHLRREKRERHSTLSFEPNIRFDLSAKVLYVSKQPVPLTKSEYSICAYLARNWGQVFTKEQIYEAVFGLDGIGDNSTISTHIKNIRAKLECFNINPISTVWGIGYKWK